MSAELRRGVLQVGRGASGRPISRAGCASARGAGCGSPILGEVERLVPEITAAVGRVSPAEQIVLPDKPSRTPHH